MKRVGPGVRSAQRSRRWGAFGVAGLAFVAALGYLAYALLDSLRMIVRPAHPGDAHPSLILMALAALVVGVGIALARRLAFVVIASRGRGSRFR